MVGSNSNRVKPAPLVLCGNELPWVDQADHLGCTITSNGSMDHDARIKRARFIASSSEIRAIFKSAAPLEIIKALKLYCGAFYGSNLWDLGGEAAQKVYSSWDTAVKLLWGCPQWTRTYFLQKILYCGQTSARVEILSRYCNFFESLKDSASFEVQVVARYVARDIRTVTGKNISLIRNLSGLQGQSSNVHCVKESLTEAFSKDVPQEDTWRMSYLCSLITQRREAKECGATDRENEIQNLINSLVKN